MHRRQVSAWGKYLLTFMFLVPVLAGCGGFGLSTPEPVEISFVYLENIADYQPLADAFQNEHPNITIKLTPVNATRDYQSNLNMMAADADTVRLSSTVISDDLLKAFLPIDGLISSGKNFPQEDLFSGSLEGLRLDGKQIGLPAGINPFVVYYLPKKFAAAGVQPPPSDWTLDDFVSIATALNNPDDALIGTDRYGYGFCSSPDFPDIALFTYLFGGGLFDSLVQVTNPTLNARGNVQALDWYASLKNDLGLMPENTNPRQVGMLVYRLGCGMWIDWLDKSTFGPEGAPEAEPLTLPSYAAQFNIASEDGYFILAKTEHPDEAFLWMSYLMEQPTASGRLIPPLRSSVDSNAYTSQTPAAIVNVARNLPVNTVVLGLEMFRNERFGQVLGLFNQAANQVMSGEDNAQFALDAAQQEAEQLFR